MPPSPASSLLSRLRTPLYQNTGSVARDHLASERTFLAWMRTGLGFVALGIAIERFSQLDLAEVLRQATSAAPATVAAASSQHQTRSPAASQQQQQQQQDRQHTDLLVGSLLGGGAGSIAYGSSRYFANLRLLEQGFFRPAYHGPALLSVFVAGLAGGVYWNTFNSRRGRDGDGREMDRR